MGFKERLGSVFFTGFETLNDYFSHTENFDKIKFNVKSLDEVFQGGIEVSSMTEIYGAAGCGKTQLCLQLAFNCRLPIELGGNDAKVLYLTTDKPACARRLNQLDRAFKAKYGDIDFLGGILISQFNKSSDFEEFVLDCVPQILQFNKVKLFIIDSIAGIYRTEHNYIQRANQMSNLFGKLEILANKYKFGILVTNHVTAVIDQIGGNDEKPALSQHWTSLLTSRVYVKKLPMTTSILVDDHEEFSKVRTLEIEFSPRLPPKTAKFIITSRGIEEDDTANKERKCFEWKTRLLRS